jgi:sigma-E factor negative regulatory protein RseA
MNDDQKREVRLRQALSALVDGEAHELEVSQVLAKAKGHDEVKARWARYQLVSAALQARGAAQGSAAVTTAHPAGAALPAAATPRRGFGWGSFALAASLTLALVVVLRSLGPSTEPSPMLAALTPSPAPTLAVPLQPVALGGERSSGSAAVQITMPRAWAASGELGPGAARHLQTLMRRHAELNLLDSAGSLVPAVRLVAHSEAP